METDLKVPNKPPRSDYPSKSALVEAINSMKTKMSEHQDKYDKKLSLLENLEIVESRRSSIIAVFVLMLILRVFLSDNSSILGVDLLANLTIKTKIVITLLMLVLVPVLYYLVFRLFKFLKIRKYNKKLQDCEADLVQAYLSYGECPISYKYAMPEFVETIQTLIVDGRADTVKEAINLIISDENSAKLLEYQDQIARSGKQTAVATSITAFFAWRNAHWSKKSYTDTKK